MKQRNDKILQLDKQVAQSITSQQIIPSLHQCIKQLVDNAIDANASLIKISLIQYGRQFISVYDNGTGIKDYLNLGSGGNTSKLNANQQQSQKGFLSQITTLGFRGQAVNSIARLCKQMRLHTTFYQQTTKNYKQVKFSISKREAISQKQVINQGSFTNIQIEKLFYSLPVRKYQLQNKPKQNIKKVYDLIFQISIIYPQITFILVNEVEKREQILFQVQKDNQTKQIISNQTKQQSNQSSQQSPNKQNKQLVNQQGINKVFTIQDVPIDIWKIMWKNRIQICFPNKLDDCLVFIQDINIQAYILNTIDSGSSRKNHKFSKNIQHIYLNRRPIDNIKQISKTFDNYYKKYNPYTKYVFFLNLMVDPSQVDINLSPNKRQILLKKELLQKIIAQIQKAIQRQIIQKVNNLQDYKDTKQKKLSKSQSKSQIKNQQSQPKYEKISIIKMNKSKQQTQQKFKNTIQDNQHDNQNNNHSDDSDYNNDENNNYNDDDNNNSRKVRQTSFRSMPSQQVQQKHISGNFLQHAIQKQFNQDHNKFSLINQLNQRVTKQLNNQHQKIINILSTKQTFQTKQQTKISTDGQNIAKHINFQINSNLTPKYQKMEIQQSFQTKRQIHPYQNNKMIQILNILKEQQRTNKKQVDLSRNIISSQAKKQQIKINSKRQEIDTTPFKQQKNLYIEDSSQSQLNTQKSKQYISKQQQHKPKRQQNGYKTQQHINLRDFRTSQKKLQLQSSLPEKRLNYVQQQKRGQIRKQDFNNFHIHGQFNKGFILCTSTDKKSLFIVDQHASQQKRLFQGYMQQRPSLMNVNIELQITPLQVDQILTSEEQLRKSGFKFQIIDRHLLTIQQCPSHFKRNFGLQQFMEVAEKNKNITNISVFYNAAASKACRTAVMIGDQLGKNQMIDIVRRMATLKSPWNCPHGRPSLISLGTFSQIQRNMVVSKPVYKF